MSNSRQHDVTTGSKRSDDPQQQYYSRARRSSQQKSDTLEEISKQLGKKITDLQDETRIQRVILSELATVNATLLSKCRLLEKENAELWNEIFRIKGPVFPNEITDIFIDFLHKDRASLAACALVCKDWLAGSRYHLFPSLTFNNSSSKRQSNLTELIDHPLCTFKLSVRRITLERVDNHQAADGESWLSTSIPCLSEFPSVTALRLVGLTPQIVQSSLFAQLWTQRQFLEGIIKLNVHKSEIPLDSQYLLEHFPNMTALDYIAEAILIFSPAGHVPLYHPFAEFLLVSLPEKWRKVSLTFPRSVWGVGMKRWFRLLRRTPTTVDLTLYEVRDADIPVLAECLRLLGPTLSSLTVGFAEERSQTSFYTSNILSRNTNLETIFLFGSLFYDSTRKGYLESLRNAPSLLSSIPNAHLRRIVLAFVFGDFSGLPVGGTLLPSSVQEDICSKIDELLAPSSASDSRSSRFPQLEEVVFKLCPPGGAFSVGTGKDLMDQVEEVWGEHFPNVTASGLMKFESEVE
ncbi:hypothetical protein D9758_005106 [Tetrapyrgos nigripes]|uniref:F-box domain-containing protein n=1 Tax=Tetrapyrgos nigripes TaxID=182062 RepID=A0A8H5GWH9_9AGAR|nr:hypothetical protein D9758_005106 [Tetrapyrgos nigripes]